MKPCQKCGGKVTERRTRVTHGIGDFHQPLRYETICDHPVHALAQEVVELVWDGVACDEPELVPEFDAAGQKTGKAHFDGCGKCHGCKVNAAVARLREEMEKP